MNRLTEILNEFWLWARISEDDYRVGKAIYIPLKGEWEDEFPKWNIIESEVKNAVKDLNTKIDEDLLDKIVTIISLDNENGIIMDYCLDHLNHMDQLIEKCVKSQLIHARFEVACRITSISVSSDLIKMLMNDEHEMIRNLVKQRNNDP